MRYKIDGAFSSQARKGHFRQQQHCVHYFLLLQQHGSRPEIYMCILSPLWAPSSDEL